MCNRILRDAPTALGRSHSFSEFGSGALGGVGVFSRGKVGVINKFQDCVLTMVSATVLIQNRARRIIGHTT